MKEQKKKDDLERKELEKRKLTYLTAFDVLMKAQYMQEKISDPREKMIPAHWISSFGKEYSGENRRMSCGSSPNLKRGSGELSSPNSPEHSKELKKNKMIASVEDHDQGSPEALVLV